MSSQSKLIGSAIAAVVLLGAAYAFTRWRERAKFEERIGALLIRTQDEFAQPKPDREAIANLVREIGKDPAAESEPRLVRARARLELLADRPQRARDILVTMALDPSAAPEDQRLLAEILLRLYGLTGKSDDASMGLRLAERHFEASGEARSLFLAWQFARREGRGDEDARLADRLAREAGTAIESRVVASLRALDVERGEPSLSALLELERDLGRAEPELDWAITLMQLKSGQPADLDAAYDRVREALRTAATWLDLRYTAAIACHARGLGEERDRHLDWLLERAPTDPRAPTWRQLRESRPGK